MNRGFAVRLEDTEAAEWLRQQAEDLFVSTRDYGWKEIAEDLEKQLRNGRGA